MNSEELRGAFVQTSEPDAVKLREYHEQIRKIEQRMTKLAREQFDHLGKEIHETNVEKGFWKEPEMMDKYAAKLALIHSEVTEVLEALRKSQGVSKVTEEFADVLIRTFDLYDTLVEAGEASPELYGIMRDKMETNKNRPPKHGNRWG